MWVLVRLCACVGACVDSCVNTCVSVRMWERTYPCGFVRVFVVARVYVCVVRV